MAKSNLVIVESPTKAKTIGKYLGSGYVVKACMGHLRDLPKSTIGVDIEGGFIPNYQPLKGKEETIADLISSAKKSARVYLATDPDREGEAISWHLKELLQLSEDKALRVTFNEITKKVVTESIEAPRPIDQNLVDAQQARRILDRIVGYQLSPLLWKKIRRGLSAGRVQSVATRLVVDREEEIRAFIPVESWTLDVNLMRTVRQGAITARFYGDPKKRELKSEPEADEIISDIAGKQFIVDAVKRSEKKKSPAPPFITSSLQQEASRKLGMSPNRTMAIAQQLYEGIDIEGEGTVGLITYMRTDSLRVSEEALEAAGQLIKSRWGESYYFGSPRKYKSQKSAQDAHEAIRPSNVLLDPENIKGDLSNDQYRLYRLIWGRFVSSQMANALYDAVAVDIASGKNIFRANHQSLKFSGFTAVYEESLDEEKDENLVPLPDLSVGEEFKLSESAKQQHFTQPPSRYTEASLVRAMEEKGVGRPSTYASTISTISDREYVIKQEKYLYPTPLGEVVTTLMKDRFTNIIDVEFTANMETNLDEVEEGKLYWKKVLEDFYKGFHATMEEAEEILKDVRIKVPDEVTEELCEVCGKNLVVKSGRFGRFLACPGYPECKFTKPIVEQMPGSCPRCGGRILKRKSMKGYTYYGCEKGAACGFMTWDVPVKETCPECGQTMFKKSGRGQRKPFCVNEACSSFLPEDKRGYKKKSAATEAETVESTDDKAEVKPADNKDKKAPKKASKKTSAASKTADKKKTSRSAKLEG